ncbi:MAG: hypothetical protein HC893_15990 [Chloroflexaceae bacterium]|nr:hypothetical protein [Chloroflexaceae bacterium]
MLLALFAAIVAPSLHIPAAFAQANTIYYVDATNGSDSNSGTGSWNNAFATVQTALAAVNGGGQIWVARGTYYPDDGLSLAPANPRTVTFRLKNNVAIYGGFAGTETQLSQRNIALNVTTLSGDIDGIPGNTENALHVVTSDGNTATAILNGFTITGGNANLNESGGSGGGIYLANGSMAQFANLTVTVNEAESGGGVYSDKSSPTFTNVFITNNMTAGSGGGVYNNGGSPTFSNVQVLNNQARFEGGGVYNLRSNSTFTNAVISNNTTIGRGGAVYNNNSTVVFSMSQIFSNVANQDGGGVYNSNDSNASYINVIIAGNRAVNGDGGGAYNLSSNPVFVNVALTGNTASEGSGGGVFNRGQAPSYINVTIARNRAKNGGGVFNFNGSPGFANKCYLGQRGQNHPRYLPVLATLPTPTPWCKVLIQAEPICPVQPFRSLSNQFP